MRHKKLASDLPKVGRFPRLSRYAPSIKLRKASILGYYNGEKADTNKTYFDLFD